jgi:hypothetical protein
MLLETLGLILMLSQPAQWPKAAYDALPSWPAPIYRPAERSVDNWRWQAARALDLPFEKALKLAAGGEAGGVTRCVRLNNYWCVKRARWAGEIAADSEGHVAFASAQEGADVAALLLRRYYLDFNRKSALDIVSRWAPAQCGAAPSGGKVSPALRAFAPRGVGGTLRARWLARHGRGGKAMKSRAPRRSAIAEKPVAMLRAPSISPGMGERAPSPLALPRMAALPAAIAAPEGKVGRAACPAETQRIRNYAQNAIKGVADTIEADLKLFDPDGAPTANLTILLENMSAVEIGPLKASRALAQAAVEAARAAPRK